MNSFMIAGNIIKRCYRNKKELLALLLLPVCIIFLMSLMIKQDAVRDLSVGVVIQDQGEMGAVLRDGISDLDGILIREVSPAEYEKELDQGRLQGVLVVPENFSGDILQGRQAGLYYYSHVLSPMAQQFIQSTNQIIVRLYAAHALGLVETAVEPSLRIFSQEKSVGDIVTVVRRTGGAILGPEEAALLTSMGFVFVFIMVMIFTALGLIMEDKKRLTLARMWIAPVKSWEIILGNILGSLVLGTIQVILLTAVIQGVYRLPFGEKLLGIFLILFVFLLAAIGIGVGVSGLIKKSTNPMILIATVITPTTILGGAFIPASMMPEVVNRIGYLVPQKWAVTAMEQIIGGEGLESILLKLLVILLFAPVMATFGYKTLKPLEV